MGKDLKGKEIGEGLSQKSNGKYSARFRSRGGKRIEKQFDKYNEAKKWLADAKYEDEHGDIAAGSVMTFDTWFWFWLNNRKQSIRDTTLRSYKEFYNSRIKEYLGDMPLSSIKPLHCQNVVNQAVENGYKYQTILKTIALLRTVFTAAVENQLIRFNPMLKSVKVQDPDRPDEPRVLTRAEEVLFLETAQKYAYYNDFRFVLQTGIRCGELIGLKWQDVNLTAKNLSIERNMLYLNNRFVIHPPKSKSGYRKIPLTEEACEILAEVKKKKKNRISFEYRDFIFTNSHGFPIANSNYDNAIKAVAKKAGMEPLSMHTLRHTFATRCIEAGMNPKTLQKILGHSDLSITMNLYVHATDETIKAEMRKFEKLGERWAKMG